MKVLDEPFDCPECHSAGSIYRDVCEICDAEFGESFDDAGGQEGEETGWTAGDRPAPRMLHPSVPLRFADVVNELREIAELASAAVEVEGTKLAAACRRAESLLRVLRAQFLQDVVLSDARARAL